MTAPKKDEQKNPVRIAAARIYGIYLLCCALNGDISIFASACSCLSFLLAAAFSKKENRKEKSVSVLLCGALGTLVSAIFCLLNGNFKVRLWLFPSAVGAVLSAFLIFFASKFSEKHRKNAECLVLVFGMFFCFM